MTEEVKRSKMLVKNFGVASFRYNRWAADLEEGQTLEDAMHPEFWAHQADGVMGHDKTNPKGVGDIIEVRKPDISLFAELLIVEIGKGYIRTELLRERAPASVEVADESPLGTKWNVGKRQHEVVRKSDNEVLKSGFQTKQAAVDWIEKHTMAVAA